MTKTPYKIQLDDLQITVEYLSIDMPRFVEPLATFNDKVGHNMSVEGKWRDRYLSNAADFTVRINFWDTDTSKGYADLVFIGKFSIKRDVAFEIPYLCERIGKWCFRFIENYVEEKPIRDKDEKIYPVPEFTYVESQWLKNYFDRQ